jgi:hypothetical protein
LNPPKTGEEIKLNSFKIHLSSSILNIEGVHPPKYIEPESFKPGPVCGTGLRLYGLSFGTSSPFSKEVLLSSLLKLGRDGGLEISPLFPKSLISLFRNPRYLSTSTSSIQEKEAKWQYLHLLLQNGMCM